MIDTDSHTLETGSLCSSISRASDEQLFGTATQAKAWFILEHPQVYGAKAVEDSDLPEVVKSHFASIVKITPGARVQLIKRDNSPYPRAISFFVGLSSEEQPRLYEFQLSKYADLLDMDLQKIIVSSDEYAKYLCTEPLYLVCTNGRRDPCCVKYGFSFYTSLADQEPLSTWQTSHVGGHRFAANLVCFPHGLFYGRLSEEDAQSVLETYRRGEFLLEKYRGRSCFPGAVQAAEYYLHSQTGDKAIDAYSLESVKSVGENRWEVIFVEALPRRRHQLAIAGVPSGYDILQSCRDLEKSKVMEYRLDAYQAFRS